MSLSMASAVQTTYAHSIAQQEEFQYHATQAVERTASRTSSASVTKEKVVDPETQVAKDVSSDSAYLPAQDDDEDPSLLSQLYARFRPLVHVALALAILGWWISATVLEATRHRWCALPARDHASALTQLFLGSSRPCGRGSSSPLSPSGTSPIRSSLGQCPPSGGHVCRTHGSAFRTTFVWAWAGWRCWASCLAVRLDSNSQLYVRSPFSTLFSKMLNIAAVF